jgi:FkbM family methyltransferase
VSFPADVQRRIDITTAVRDCDPIAKVEGAGEVREVGGERVQVMHNGVLVEADGYCGTWMTEVIRRLDGHHEPQEEAAFHAVVQRLTAEPHAPVMIELGAYWAYYSLWLLHERPDARVVCVEPDATHQAVGEHNLALNNRQARWISAAAGPRHGATVRLRRDSDGRMQTTPVVSLAGVMEAEGLDRVDLVLCDVQGAEVALLRSWVPLLREQRVRFLVVSTHHWSISGDPLTHEDCLAAVESAGAHVLVEHTVQESCSGDGLIVASTDPRDRDLEIEITRCRARDSLFGGLERDLAAALRVSDPARRAASALYARFDRARRRRAVR